MSIDPTVRSIVALRANIPEDAFTAGSLVELMHKQCYTLPERPAMLVPDLPPELDEFICVLLDKNPARRPATAAAVLEELERIRGKLERKGERVEWPAKITPDTAESIRRRASGAKDLILPPMRASERDELCVTCRVSPRLALGSDGNQECPLCSPFPFALP